MVMSLNPSPSPGFCMADDFCEWHLSSFLPGAIGPGATGFLLFQDHNSTLAPEAFLSLSQLYPLILQPEGWRLLPALATSYGCLFSLLVPNNTLLCAKWFILNFLFTLQCGFHLPSPSVHPLSYGRKSPVNKVTSYEWVCFWPLFYAMGLLVYSHSSTSCLNYALIAVYFGIYESKAHSFFYHKALLRLL